MTNPRHHTPVAAADAPHEEVARLRAELTRVSAERDALDARAGGAVEELRDLLARQTDVLHDTLDARIALVRIRSGLSWRILETLRRLRLGLRRLWMTVRGLRRRRRRRSLPVFVAAAPLGVNVAGYLSTESGMGEAARLMIRSLDAAGVPVALNNVSSRLRMHDTSYTQFAETNPHPFNLVHLNADNMEWFADGRGRQYFRDRYTIGYWFWELAEFRPDWMSGFNYVDEVWTASEFGRSTLAGRSPVPIACMPLPVVPPPPPSPHGRSHFGLSGDAFVFLFTFDVSSQMERKNPLGLIRAFRRAFTGRQDVTLVLKFTNAEYDRRAVERLHEAVEGLNVILLGSYMAREELAGLMRAADCYVSLHRSEGFGLGIAEAMALGKPVIATRYSGCADLLTAENSFPVQYRVVPIDRDYGPYLRGFTWAEPDLDHAAALMRHVVENPGAAGARGDRAAADMAACRAPERTGARARQRLEEIRTGRRFDSPLLGPFLPASS